MKHSKSKVLAYLAGLIVGDGHLETTKKRIIIATSNEAFKNKINELLHEVGVTPCVFFDENAGVWKLSVTDPEFFEEINVSKGVPKGNKTFKPFNPIIRESEEIAFLSGLMDAEGWFEFDKGKYFKLRVKMKNHAVMRNVFDILKKRGFKPASHVKSDECVVVEVNRQKEVEKLFAELMLFHPKWQRANFSQRLKA